MTPVRLEPAALRSRVKHSTTEPLRSLGGGGGGGGGVGCGTLIFSYIRRRGSFFGFKILKFSFLGSFQKNEYFLGMKILWIFLGGHHKIRLYLGVNSMHFWVFINVKVQNGGILGGLLKFQIFLGFL